MPPLCLVSLFIPKSLRSGMQAANPRSQEEGVSRLGTIHLASGTAGDMSGQLKREKLTNFGAFGGGGTANARRKTTQAARCSFQCCCCCCRCCFPLSLSEACEFPFASECPQRTGSGFHQRCHLNMRQVQASKSRTRDGWKLAGRRNIQGYDEMAARRRWNQNGCEDNLPSAKSGADSRRSLSMETTTTTSSMENGNKRQFRSLGENPLVSRWFAPHKKWPI